MRKRRELNNLLIKKLLEFYDYAVTTQRASGALLTMQSNGHSPAITLLSLVISAIDSGQLCRRSRKRMSISGVSLKVDLNVATLK